MLKMEMEIYLKKTYAKALNGPSNKSFVSLNKYHFNIYVWTQGSVEEGYFTI